MKKDIPHHKVEDFAVAIVPRRENGQLDEEMWDVYIINMKAEPIQNVLVNSRGYGELEGELMKTTILRHFFNEVEAKSAVHVEPIQTKLFEIANEYWVSFSFGDYMYDKKYVFVQGSINEDNFTEIPFLNCKGVMIR